MFGRFHSYVFCDGGYHIDAESAGFFGNAFDLRPICVRPDILKKVMPGGGQFPDIDTVLLRVRASTKGDKPRFGTVFHGIKNVVIVKSGFKLDLISGRISRIFAKHIKNIGPCIANEVAIVVKIRVFFHAEHNSADAIHV